MLGAALADGAWLAIDFAAGAAVGAAVAVLVARRRGHLRMSIEVGDTPDPPPGSSRS